MIVKRVRVLLLIFFVIAALSAAQERVKEEVKVVNVEVPVRVFYKGSPVDHLTIDDFKLYENKKKQTIDSLNIVRKKIKVDQNKPRCFVFLFRITNYNDQFREGLRYIFANVLNRNDKIFVLINNGSMLSYRLIEKGILLSALEKKIEEQARLDRGKLTSYSQRIEQEIGMRRFASSRQRTNFITVQDFLKKYLRIWKDYKQKYLLPNLEKYYHLCSQLERIKREKWVINFYQMEMLPNIIIPGEVKRGLNRFTDNLLQSTRAEDVSYGRILRTLLNEIEEQTNIVLDFPVEEIIKMFYKVDTTFHTVFSRTTIGVESRDHESMAIISDMEKCIGDMTTSTGGMPVSSNEIKSAVSKIVEKEDVYYLLTYAPKKPGKTGKIKIKTKKKYRVIYDDNMRADYIEDYLRKRKGQIGQLPAIRIKELDIRDKKLCVSIGDFLLKKTEKGQTGHIGIRIRLESAKGRIIFDQKKLLTPDRDIITISIPINNLKKGKYTAVVYVGDRLTGKSDHKLIEKIIK